MKAKTRKKIIVSGVVVLALIVCTISLTAVATTGKNEISLYSDGSLTADEASVFVKDLQKKSLSNLVDGANDLDFSKTPEDKIGYYYQVIKTKLADAASGDITKMLLNDKNTDDVKANLLMICSAENIPLDYDKLLPILYDENVSNYVKSILIDLMSGEGDKYVEEIEKQARSSDNPIIMEALTSLMSHRPESAMEISNEILSDLSESFDRKHKAALITKANLLHDTSDTQEIQNFVNLCDEILKTMPADDVEDKEVIVIDSLSLMQKKESFFYLMNLENAKAIDFRSFVVHQNQPVIEELLKETPNADTVALLAKVFFYYAPEEEYKEMLRGYLEKNADYFAENLAQKDELLEVIK